MDRRIVIPGTRALLALAGWSPSAASGGRVNRQAWSQGMAVTTFTPQQGEILAISAGTEEVW
jgi:hypothetical protein